MILLRQNTSKIFLDIKQKLKFLLENYLDCLKKIKLVFIFLSTLLNKLLLNKSSICLLKEKLMLLICLNCLKFLNREKVILINSNLIKLIYHLYSKIIPLLKSILLKSRKKLIELYSIITLKLRIQFFFFYFYYHEEIFFFCFFFFFIYFFNF